MSDLQEANDRLADLIDEMKRRWQLSRERIAELEQQLVKHREASAITIRKMGEALDRAQQKVRDQEGRFTNPYRSDLDRAVAAEKCIEEVRAALAMVAPRSLTFRRIRDALNRYDEAK